MRSIRSMRPGRQIIFAISVFVGLQSAADALTGVATAQVGRPSIGVGRGVAPVPYVGGPRADTAPVGGTNDPGVDVIPRDGVGVAGTGASAGGAASPGAGSPENQGGSR